MARTAAGTGASRGVAMPGRIATADTHQDTLDPAAALYFGEVMHARLKPMGHRFSYRVMSLLIDLDRLNEADRQSVLFAVNRAALYSFCEADHGKRDGSTLRAYAQNCAVQHGINLAGGRVWLLCYPRQLGFTFNPLSVYFCYRAGVELTLKIVAAIHWQALRLWLKGARLVPRPDAAAANAALQPQYRLGDRQTRRL